MVALKLITGELGVNTSGVKQERRGGIETARHFAQDLVERLREAGTPWWH